MKNLIKSSFGFTLIELLVVISIIGVLSSMVVVSLNDARGKARDAKRLSDVRQMANVLAIAATEGTRPLDLTGCNAATTEKNVRSCTGPESIANTLKLFSDSNIINPDDPNTICRAGATAPCQYSFNIGSTNVANAQIYFFLETNIAGWTSRLHAIDIEGSIY
ncbi:MAG: type II secretion system protein [Patescibacteria group bacterium]